MSWRNLGILFLPLLFVQCGNLIGSGGGGGGSEVFVLSDFDLVVLEEKHPFLGLTPSGEDGGGISGGGLSGGLSGGVFAPSSLDEDGGSGGYDPEDSLLFLSHTDKDKEGEGHKEKCSQAATSSFSLTTKKETCEKDQDPLSPCELLEHFYRCKVSIDNSPVDVIPFDSDGADRFICMSKNACKQIVSTKFQSAKPKQWNGCCNDPNSVNLPDEEIQDLINELSVN